MTPQELVRNVVMGYDGKRWCLWSLTAAQMWAENVNLALDMAVAAQHRPWQWPASWGV